MRSPGNCSYKIAKKATKVSLNKCSQNMPYGIYLEIFRGLLNGKFVGLSELCSKFINTYFWEYLYIRYWKRSISELSEELYSEPWPVKVVDLSLTHSTSQRNSLNSSRTGNIINFSPTREVPGLNGLENIGNTCFMNSVIQCLSNTKPILEYVIENSYLRDIKNRSTFSVNKALILPFAVVTKKLWSEKAVDHTVDPTWLKDQVQKLAPFFIGNDQQDAHEFLRYLLQGLHEDVNRVTEKPEPLHTEIDEELSDSEKSDEAWARYQRIDNSEIVDNFVGQLKSTLKCMRCENRSVTFEPFWDLSLPIPQREDQVRLSHCLESFTKKEVLYGDEKPTCPKCKERKICIKSLTIQKLPKILVIHLKRFSSEQRGSKLSVTVDFPLEGLDMSQYAADNVTPCKYNLYAVSNHSGSASRGHYMAYCRHPYAKTWHKYNDSTVSSISSESIVTRNAYVLFYELEE